LITDWEIGGIEGCCFGRDEKAVVYVGDEIVRFLLKFYKWIYWLLPVGLGAVGWRMGRWLGMVGGIFLGLILAVVFWARMYMLVFRSKLERRRGEMEKLSTEELTKIAADPKAREMAFAIGALDKRGIQVRPSLESLCELLVSPNQNMRRHAMTVMFGIYPEEFSKIGEGSSSEDSAEMWRKRVAKLGVSDGSGTDQS
jgi:hypothetical protein